MAIQGSDIGASRDESDERTPRLIDPEDRYRLSAAERRRLGMELISLAAALAAAALILIDLLSDARLSWSLYAVVSLAMAWLASITPFAFHGKAWLGMSTLGVAVIAYLLTIDGLDGNLTWSAGFGVPIAMLTVVVVAFTALMIRGIRVKGINCLGIGAIGLALYLVGLEVILRVASGMAGRPYWSVVAALTLVPVAILLFYVHRKVLRGANLRKLFRL
jgi:hypothetical protein